MTKIILGVAFAGLSVSMAQAFQIKPPTTPPQVPEIDALAGTAALATIGASVALLWERRGRK